MTYIESVTRNTSDLFQNKHALDQYWRAQTSTNITPLLKSENVHAHVVSDYVGMH